MDREPGIILEKIEFVQDTIVYMVAERLRGITLGFFILNERVRWVK